MDLDMKKITPAALHVATTAGGAIAAGYLRKKVTFFDNTLGKLLLILAGIWIVSQSKSEVMKGLGTGVAMNGALGFATGLLGVDGLNGNDNGMGTVVQDENGMVYLVNGTGEVMPYEIPVVDGIGNADDFQAFSGINGGNSDALVIA